MSIESRKHQYGTVFGHWKILDTLGTGSRGRTAVFRLQHKESVWGESVVKVVNLIEERGTFDSLPDNRKKEYEAALRSCTDKADIEVQFMDRLKGNTHIVDYADHTFEDWTDDSTFGRDMLIRMELLRDLRKDIISGKEFSEPEIIKIGQDICKALVLCHRKDILHRDIKPENIFVNADGNYKLGDFGISRILDQCPGSVASTDIGTPEYAAPEQGFGDYDHRVDIYSLGIVLYELSNGNKLPFATSSYVAHHEIARRMKGERLPVPSGVSSKLATVILKACAYSKHDRFQSADELLSALDSLCLPSVQTTATEAVVTEHESISHVVAGKSLGAHDTIPAASIGHIKEVSKEQDAVVAGQALPDSQIQPIPMDTGYSLPIDLLKRSPDSTRDASSESRKIARAIHDVLQGFELAARILNVESGITSTVFDLEFEENTAYSIKALVGNQLEVVLGRSHIRTERLDNEPNMARIIVPNESSDTVCLREVIDTHDFYKEAMVLPIGMGKTTDGAVCLRDITKLPHLLVGGMAGSGKSSFLHSILISLIMRESPAELKLLLVDTKANEFNVYKDIPHLLTPMISNPTSAIAALEWLHREMMKRYEVMSAADARSLDAYNTQMTKVGNKPLPRIVYVVDEFEDFMRILPQKAEELVCRIAQMGRPVGIHLILSTQNVDPDVYTGLIKANFPSRVAFRVNSARASRIVIDKAGAEELIHPGDMIVSCFPDEKLIPARSCYVSMNEIEGVISFLKNRYPSDYDEKVATGIDNLTPDLFANAAPEDIKKSPLYSKAVETILEVGYASVSIIQRKLKLGYSLAALIMDALEAEKIVGPFNGSASRKVLITKEEWTSHPTHK